MIHQCYETASKGLSVKGVLKVIDCPVEELEVKTLPEIRNYVEILVERVFPGLRKRIEFDSNEPIGYTHSLHRFRAFVSDDKYLGVRIVLRSNRLIRVLFTVPNGFESEPLVTLSRYDPSRDTVDTPVEIERSLAPPGQVYIDIPVVYAILGVPRIDLSNWFLELNGEVDKPTRLTLVDLYELGVVDMTTSFHCVTGWSIRRLDFTGVPVPRLIQLVKPREEVRWVYVESLDGYTTIVPYEDFNHEESMIALEMNGKPLDTLHGYPARLVIPRLYGWKSAKWVSKIVFTRKYIDGYWEALGYHPRGNVMLEERFKKS